MKPPKPNFLIVGSAKCGTTALDSILASHPDCCMGRPKEVCFFQDTMDFEINPNFEKGWEWYQKAFLHYKGEVLVGEATPSYSDRSRSPNTARRIADFNPDMKIIYMVRKPLERQISAWKMQYFEATAGYWPDRVETQWATRGFSYWLEHQRDAGQWDISRYGFQLEAYREYFPDESILVSFLESWITNKEAEVDRIMEFLGLDSKLWDSTQKESANRQDDRKLEKTWYRNLRNSRLARGIARAAPRRLKRELSERLGSEKAEFPEPDLTDPIVKEFVEYTESDWRSIEPFRSKSRLLCEVTAAPSKR